MCCIGSYGDMPESVTQEMESVHNELVQMDQQIEKDKAVMQRKILIACDACEHSYEVLHQSVQEEVKWLERTGEIKYQLSKCIKRATALTLGKDLMK